MLLNLLLMLWCAQTSPGSPGSTYSYTLQEDSWLQITGSSSVNTFECISVSNEFNGYLDVSTDGSNSDAIHFTDAQLLVDIQSFDCKNHLLSRDLHRALGAEKSPFITIELTDATPVSSAQNSGRFTGTIDAKLAITLNGSTKNVEVPVDWYRSGFHNLIFKGTTHITITDFGISPPSPFFGLVKVNEQIEITFSMRVEVHPTNNLANSY